MVYFLCNNLSKIIFMHVYIYPPADATKSTQTVK